MGFLESITHSEEIENLKTEGENRHAAAVNKFNLQQKRTTQSLENLGEIKIAAWSKNMDGFIRAFSAFNNIEVVKTIDTNMNFVGCDQEPRKMIANMQQSSMEIMEIAESGIAAVGSGALMGIATYGGAVMFGKASTGAAIKTLSGAAKKNATLAYLGKGAKAAGGLGMAGGKLLLAGAVAAPILAVGTAIASAKANENLAKAKAFHADATAKAKKLNYASAEMRGIETLSNNYSDFLKKIGKKFSPFVHELERIKAAHPVNGDEPIDFNSLSTGEQKTLHLSWLLAQIYYRVLSTPILTDEGEIAVDAKEVLSSANKDYEQFVRDTSGANKEDAENSSAHSYAAAPKAAAKAKQPSRIKALIILFIVVIAVMALGIYEVSISIPVQYAADALIGNTYDDVVDKLEKAGFSNVWPNEIADLPVNQISNEYVVTEVKIGGNSTFSETAKLPSNSPVTVTYHTLKEAKVPMSNYEAKGTNYKDVQAAFKNAGFINVKTEAEYDILLGWFTKDGEVDSVVVGGDKEYESWSRYKVNTEVVITYHTFIGNKPD